MQRREMIRLLLGTAAVPLLPREVLAVFRQVHEQLPSTSALKTLNPHQDATVTMVAELIIPETKTPGAKSVRVNEFIDLILSDWYDEEDRAMFLDGLASVDKQCRDLYGKDFVDCSAAQQKQLLTELDEELTEVRQLEIRGRRHQKVVTPHSTFFGAMKQLTLMGYFTSEEGAKQALHFEIIPSHHEQCGPLETGEAAQ
jgi:hypothetical protein